MTIASGDYKNYRELSDYREVLKRELSRRCATNPRYSLRAFARDLGLVPSRISGILNRRHGLSRQKALLVAQKLNLSELEKNHFCDLVESEHARSATRRKLVAENLRKEFQNAPRSTYAALSLDQFQLIRNWYHLAILELTQTAGFRGSSHWIARRLGISWSESKLAIERLVRLGLLKTSSKRWSLTSRSHATQTNVPSDAIREFHRQILLKATHALDAQSVDERDFSAMVFSVPRSKLAEAKEELRAWRRKFSDAYEDLDHKDEVYCLSMQFFRLTQKMDGD